MTSIKILLESATEQAEVIPMPKSVRIDQWDQFDSFSAADALRLSGNPINHKIHLVEIMTFVFSLKNNKKICFLK